MPNLPYHQLRASNIAKKNSIPYSQILRIKRICSAKKDFGHHSRELKERFLKQGYDQKIVDKQLEKEKKLVRNNLLEEKDRERQDSYCIPFMVAYKRFLPNLTAVVRKTWNIFQASRTTNDKLQEKQKFKRIIGSKMVKLRNLIFPLK